MASGWRPFPYQRRLILDICRISQTLPLFSVEATFRLGDLVAARERSRLHISWATLFLRAAGILGAEEPLLRQSYMAWPWPHFYEHDRAVISLMVAREFEQQPFVAVARFENPGWRDLPTLQAELDRFKHADPATTFREQLLFSRLPNLVRTAIWRIFVNGWGRKKARKFGTFGITTLAGQGVINRQPPGVLSYNLSYGPVDAHGHCVVTLLCDHRVVDGVQAAKLLNGLQDTLRGRVLAELQQLSTRQAAA